MLSNEIWSSSSQTINKSLIKIVSFESLLKGDIILYGFSKVDIWNIDTDRLSYLRNVI